MGEQEERAPKGVPVLNSERAQSGAPGESAVSRHQVAFSVLLTEVLAVAVLSGLTAVRMWSFGGLLNYDERWYFETGLRLVEGFHLPFAEGPGYCWVYGAVQALTRSTQLAAAIGSLTGPVVMVLGVYVAARLVASRRTAIAVALVLASTYAPYHRPGVTSFAAGLAVAALALAATRRDPRSRVLASGLLWVAAAARPEYALAAALASGLTLWWLVGSAEVPARRARLFWVAVAMAIPVAMLMQFGPPWGTGRLWVAFGQHYSHGHELPWREWDVWKGPSLTPDQEWAVVAEDFGSATSITQAVASEPARVLRYQGLNALRTPVAFAHTTVVNGPPPVLPLTASASLLLLIFGGLGADTAVRRLHAATQNDRARVLADPVRYVPALVLFGMSVATTVVVWPRTHYLQLWVAGMAVFAASGLCSVRALTDRRFVERVRALVASRTQARQAAREAR